MPNPQAVEKKWKQSPFSERYPFRNRVTIDGSSGFKAEADRYHLYVGYECRFTHVVWMILKLKGLDDVIPVDVVETVQSPEGEKFVFSQKHPDSLHGKNCLREIYLLAKPEFQGVVCVPVLWDKRKQTIVTNSADAIASMFDTVFNAFCSPKEKVPPSLCPGEHLEVETFTNAVEQLTDLFNATKDPSTPLEYLVAVSRFLSGLDSLNSVMERRRYLMGENLSVFDLQIFAILVRFHEAQLYNHRIKRSMFLNKQLKNFKHLAGFVCDIYSLSGVEHTMWWHQVRHIAAQEGSLPLDLVFGSSHRRQWIERTYSEIADIEIVLKTKKDVSY